MGHRPIISKHKSLSVAVCFWYVLLFFIPLLCASAYLRSVQLLQWQRLVQCSVQCSHCGCRCEKLRRVSQLQSCSTAVANERESGEELQSEQSPNQTLPPDLVVGCQAQLVPRRDKVKK